MRIVIAEDDLVSRKLLDRAVTALGHSCMVSEDGEAAWKLIQDHQPDAIISDWMMPKLDGLGLCRRLRAHEEKSGGYTYFVLLTSLSEQTDRLRGMQAGADDYLTKPLDPDELQLRLICARRITALHLKLARQQEELERLNRSYYEDGRIDQLTGIGNRRMMEEDLDRISAQGARYGHGYAVALFDIDFFKKYNDTCGHPAGDETLRAVAAALRAAGRRGDVIYRYGGEEFLALLPGQDEVSGRLAADRLRVQVEAMMLPHPGTSPPSTVTVSGGIAAHAAGIELEPAEIIERADRALYLAKETGRNKVANWTEAEAADGADLDAPEA
jgi:two-component system cell cycle response regulator